MYCRSALLPLEKKSLKSPQPSSEQALNRHLYEAVSDQGPVWVQSEEKIPSSFKSTPNIIFSMPRSSLVTKLSEKVWHVQGGFLTGPP